jgi:hypothetical protein
VALGEAGVFLDFSTSGPTEWGCVAQSGRGCGFPFPLTRNVALLIAQARPLFVLDGVEDGPSLQTIRDLLAALPAAGIAPRREGTLGKLNLSSIACNATGSVRRAKVKGG